MGVSSYPHSLDKARLCAVSASRWEWAGPGLMALGPCRALPGAQFLLPEEVEARTEDGSPCRLLAYKAGILRPWEDSALRGGE